MLRRDASGYLCPILRLQVIKITTLGRCLMRQFIGRRIRSLKMKQCLLADLRTSVLEENMANKFFLILTKIMLGGWGLLFLIGSGWGLLYSAATFKGLFTRPELWINLGLGFGSLFSIYCVLSSLNVFRRKILLASGILMQIAAILCVIWSYNYYYPKLPDNSRFLTTDFYLFGIFAVLWWLHFVAVFIYVPRTSNLLRPQNEMS
jgi:hypothetical protein